MGKYFHFYCFAWNLELGAWNFSARVSILPFMSPRTVRLGLVQMQSSQDGAVSLKKAIDGIAAAKKKGAQIVALPELFLNPYFCQRKDDNAAFALAQPVPGPTTEALQKAAKENSVVLVGGSIFEKASDGKFYNTAVVIESDGTLLGTYRKTHIPEDLLYHEQQYFAPGDTGINVFDTSMGKIAPLICYDQWYPEAARIAVLQGAELLIYPTAIGVIDQSVEENITGDWEQMWRAAQVGHAAANCVYVAAVNRVGKEGAITFWGGSFIADPSAAVLAKGGAKEEIVIADLDLNRISALQKAWRFIENRRPEVYGEITRS
jgi:predicted amidohydrolase